MLWGFSSDIRMTLLLALLTFVALLINKDPLKKPINSGLFILIILFLFHSGIANVFTEGNSSVSWTVWGDFFKATVFCGLSIVLLTTRNRIETFVYVLLIGIGFNIFFEGLKFVATLGSYKIIGIQNSMMTDNNLFAMVILMTLPLYFYAIDSTKLKWLKLGFTGLAGLSAITVIGSFSRGGFVGLLLVSWNLFFKSKSKPTLLILGLIFATVAIQIGSDKWTDRVKTIENSEQDESFLGRVTAWKLATVAALDNPLLGTGQDSIQHTYIWMHYYRDIRKMDFIPTRNVSPEKGKAAHSIYFQVLGDSGFIGLFLFLLILGKAYFKSRYLAKHSTVAWIKNLSQAINLSLLLYIVSGSLLSMAYYDLFYVLVALIINLEYLNKHQREHSPLYKEHQINPRTTSRH